MMKKIFKTTAILLTSAALLFALSCTIGLGDAVDTSAPTIDISYPPKNAVIRDSFIVSGICDDDLGLESVKVTVTNTATKDAYGPYEATLSSDKKSWSVELNKKAEGEYDAFNAYKQWEYPDGDYIVSAVSYDKSEKASQAASLPFSIDNTAPVLIVSKPLAVGTETASVYGRNLNIIGDISEAHETTKLTLNYKEFNESTNTFIDSATRTLEITGFGTMSSDNPLTIAKYNIDSSEADSAKLTQNYLSIYGTNIDLTQSNKKNFYCGFQLEDSARVYRNPGDAGEEGGNQTSQYFILSDNYNENLFSETTYSLNARNLMLLLNGQSGYSETQIADITSRLRETGNSASSTEINAATSSKFSIDPKNNPVWSITNFDFADGTFGGYDIGSAVPLVLKVGGDGIEIDKSSIEIEIYHLGNGEFPESINASTPHCTLISRGTYTEGSLKEALDNDSSIVFSSTDTGIKINHFYEFRISGTDVSGNSIESEDGKRFGFKRNSTFASPRITFVTDSESYAENAFYKGTTLDSDGITIKGTIVTGAAEIAIPGTNNLKVSGITITDTSDSNVNISASETNSAAEVKFNTEITSFTCTDEGVEAHENDSGRGKTYTFTAKITKKAGSNLSPVSRPGAYKYKVAFIAEDSYNTKSEATEFEFRVDNKAPEISVSDITPVVQRGGANSTKYINGSVTVKGTVSDVGSGFAGLFWGIGDDAPTQVTEAGATWSFELNTLNYNGSPLTDQQEHILKLYADDNVGNRTVIPYTIHVNQSTDTPVIDFTNAELIFTKTNNKLVGTITDDDGLGAVKFAEGPAPDKNQATSLSISRGTTSYGFTITLPETEGQHQITLFADDIVGLSTGSESISQPVIVDNGAPELTITSSTSAYYSNAVSINGTVKDGSGSATIVRNVYKFEGSSYSSTPVSTAQITPGGSIVDGVSWSDSYTPSENGSYKIEYVAVDAYAERTGLKSTKSIAFIFDNEAPTISSVNLNGNPISGWYNKNYGNFSVEISEDVTSVQYSKDNTNWVTMSGSGKSWNADITFEGEGTEKHLYFKATDKAGNVSDVRDITLNMDVNAPTVTVKSTGENSLSGNVYVNKENNITFEVTYSDGTGESGVVPLEFKISDAPLSSTDVSVTKAGNIYTVVINANALASGQLTVIGKDNATNTKEVTACTFIVDTVKPEINGLTLSMSNSSNVHKKAGSETTEDIYYINRSSTATLTITGAATDNYEFENITLRITGTGQSEIERNSSDSSWSFSGLNLASWTDAAVTLTAKDKAGNEAVQTFEIKFDETAPVLEKDEVEETSYTFRGDTVTKATSIKLGSGRYSAQSYGRQTSVEVSTYLTEAGSGLSKLEYRLYAAGGTLNFETMSAADLRDSFDNASANTWTSSGSFNIEETNPENLHDVKAIANISGFKTKSEAGNDTNYLLLRPTDNCGNEGTIEILSIHVDQTAPTVVATSSERLTNGTANLVISGSVYDVDAGLKALRVLVDGNVVLATDGELSNRYGSFTYTGYKSDYPTNAADDEYNPPVTSTTDQYLLADAPNYATWTLTLTPDSGQNDSWFDALPNLPVIAVEAEDWAEHTIVKNGVEVREGNKAPNATKVAVLKIDTEPPVVSEIKLSSADNNKNINGVNTITGTSSDVGSVPVKLDLYYSLETSAPASIDGYQLIKTLTTARSPDSPGLNVSQLYNFNFDNIDFYDSRFISSTEARKGIWLLVAATDEAGNMSAINHPEKYTIDRHADRPTIYFTDLDLTNTFDEPAILKEKKIYINISDDDGIVENAAFKITRGNYESAWNTILLRSGSGNFSLEDDGTQIICFKVTDKNGKVFTTTESNEWDKVYIKDAASVQNTISQSIPVTLDTSSPEVTITEINGVASASFDKVLGGTTKSLQIKFTAIDTGSGIKEASPEEATVKAIVKLGDAAVGTYRAAPVSGESNTYAVTIPCDTGTGVLNVKIVAVDKVGREGSTEKQFDIDNTPPEIHVESPDSHTDQSGSMTAIGYVTENVTFSYAVTQSIDTPAAYTNYCSNETEKISTFYIYFDGHNEQGPNHTKVLNTWLVDLGITTTSALNATDSPFDNIVQLYLHLKAVDASGNTKELAYPFLVDPQGDRPKVYLNYPTNIISTDDTSNKVYETTTLGGAINVMGSVSGKTATYKIYMQIDQDGDGDWDDTDKSILESSAYGYTLTAIPGLTGQYGIEIPVNGSVWSKKINENGEFNPAAIGQRRTIYLRLYAVDSEDRISSDKIAPINIDNDVPVINQDIDLVQWNAGFDASNGFTVSPEGEITYAENAVKVMRKYSEGMNIAGQWYVVGLVSDDSGISEVGKKVINPITNIEEEKPFTTTLKNGEYITSYTKDGKTNYAFSFPIGSNETGAVGTSEVKFYAKDTGSGTKAKLVNKSFKLNYDNKAPELTTPIASGLKILNTNGYYTIGTDAFENSIGGANQSGVERIVFYFTRTLSGSPATILNPMIKTGTEGNALPLSDFELGEEGLYWKSIVVTDIADSVVTVESVPVFAHKGGLVKVNGTIYKINNISGNDITLSGNPGDASSILFTVAGVIDSPAPEDIPASASKISANYGFGYPNSTHDDGDLMPESCVKSGTKCTWEASINSKNISDGPVTLYYIVFDKAGNYSKVPVSGAVYSATGTVQNNSPRLAGAYVGTDENGNGTVEDSELKSYHHLYAGGYNGVKKITELTIPTESSNTSPVSAIKIKRNTVIKPEIVGGNGTVGYTYEVSARNATGWADPYKTPISTPIDLGTGTGDSENEVNLGTNGGIILTVKDLLASGITDGENQKFKFTIWDSTPGLEYGSTTQSAVLNVIMDVALNDTTPAANKIIPFYWKSAKENSLKDNSKDKGHIELSKDLPDSFTSRNPKISGAVKLEGIAQDNSLLKNLSVNIGSNTYGIASYSNGSWTENSGTGWSSKIRQATYAEFVAAGYIDERPAGKKVTDSVPYASQEYGHVVHWTMTIDTEALRITPAENITITVSAEDFGSASLSGSGDSASVNYNSNDFVSSSSQTGGDEGTDDYTSSYYVDVVPYIKGIKTSLSKKSKKTDTSEYDRTALGHYPVAAGEAITITGFNLGGTVIFTSADATPSEVAYTTGEIVIPSNAKSGKVKIIVNSVESLNNVNNNNAQGSYGAELPAISAYGNRDTYTSFTNFYNRKPNSSTNYILTDDVEIDVWDFNNEAAKPSKSGVISDPIMKINPFNNIIGFAYQSGPRVFSMAEKENSYKEWLGDYDNLSATGFAYDSAGNTYGTALGGDINGTSSVAKFAFMSSLWGQSGTGNDRNKAGDRHMRFEQIGQIGTKADKSMAGSSGTTDVEGNFIDKTRALSPSIAVSGSGVNAKVYLAYYDHLNQEIRFRWASKPKSGVRGWDGVGYINDNYGSKNLGANGNATNLHGQSVPIDKYSVIEFQIIAESKAYTYNAAGKGTETTSTALGKPGSYVSIDVIPKGTSINGSTLDKDIIVLVWYDEDNNNLMYTYNKIDFETLAAGANKADFEGSAKTKDHWETPKQIFTGAGQYCQVKVDAKGGVHIAAYDNIAGDVRYAKLNLYNSSYSESTMSCIVDSNGIVGSNLTLDVALDSEAGNAIPYISYYGSIGPKMAYLTTEGVTQTALAKGSINDKFTGLWEVTEIPTHSNAPKDRINVGVWKTSSGVINWSTTDGNVPAGSNVGSTTHDGAGITSASGTTYGNGTKNPVVAYEVRPTNAYGYMETAQMR